MTEFVGRTGAQRLHSYPETPRGGGALAFASNFAIGPSGEGTPVLAAGTQIPWSLVAVPGTGPEDVPITPRITGRIRISGVVTVLNGSVNSDNVTLQLQVNDVTVALPAPETSTGQSGEGGFVAIPYLVVLTGLPIGVQANIQMLVTAQTDGEISVTSGDSTMDVEEILSATG